MSFMYNPFPYDDPRAVNRPQLPAEAVESVVGGTLKAATALAAEFAARMDAAPGRNLVVAFDGYATADWSRMINLLSQQLKLRNIGLEAVDFRAAFKSEQEIRDLIDPLLEWDREKDPTLLYGRIFRGGYEALLDETNAEDFRLRIAALRPSDDTRRVVVVYGSGCLMPRMRDLYDVRCYFDVTPKESILRIRRGQYANLGDRTAQPANQVIRRCYYADFEMAVHLRGELLREGLLDYYVASDRPDHLQLIPRKALEQILAAMATYPFRCKPVYLEGVWGGTYVKKLRNLPDTMRNCAWVFDLIPMEVSIVVEAGAELLEFPFFSFVQREGEAIMGARCVEKFGGYFPIRFNYDDSYHSTGNMSIQVHSGAQYNHDNYDELGRQDESYYVVVAGHHAKTFIGFRDDADIDAFIRDIKLADKEYKPVDYLKYVSYEDSKPRGRSTRRAATRWFWRSAASRSAPIPTNSTTTCARTSTANRVRSTRGTASGTWSASAGRAGCARTSSSSRARSAAGTDGPNTSSGSTICSTSRSAVWSSRSRSRMTPADGSTY